MKKLITILLFFLTITSYGQTQLDMLTFNALNEYRIEHGVKPLVFDSLVWEVAEHHSVYLQDNGYPYNYPLSSGHFEMELEFPSDRLKHFGVKYRGTSGECIASWGGGDSDIDNVTEVIRMWDSSPSHKAGMLATDVTRVAISMVGVDWEKTYSWVVSGKVSTYTMSGTRYVATLLAVR